MNLNIGTYESDNSLRLILPSGEEVTKKKVDKKSQNRKRVLEIVGVGHEMFNDEVIKLVYSVYEHYSMKGERLNTHEVQKMSLKSGKILDEVQISRGRSNSRRDMMDYIIYERG